MSPPSMLTETLDSFAHILLAYHSNEEIMDRYDYYHQELDEFVQVAHYGEVIQIINEFGLDEALDLFHAEEGSRPTVLKLFYHILNSEMTKNEEVMAFLQGE